MLLPSLLARFSKASLTCPALVTVLVLPFVAGVARARTVTTAVLYPVPREVSSNHFSSR